VTAPGALSPGAQIGAYRIDRILGRGGMGIVYRALDAQGNEVALKVLSAQLESDPEALRRFDREALAATKVRHENVARCIEAGNAGGVRFIALELVPGGSLRNRLEKQGPLDWLETARVGAQMARGLAAVHAAGIVHRDLKPDNVLIAKDGSPRLTDFGLVRRAPDRSTLSMRGSLTQDGTLLGTPSFMAPEQIDHPGDVDTRADLYALGATIFAILTGRPPFLGDGIGLLKDVLTTPPPRPRDFGECPAALEGVILGLLAKTPEERPTSAEEVAVALEEIAGISKAPAHARGSRARGLLLAAAALLLVVGGGIAGVTFASRSGPAGPSAPPASSGASSTGGPSNAVPVPGATGPRKVTLRRARTLATSRWSREARWPAPPNGWTGGTCAFLPDGRVVTGGWDGILRLWDPRTLEQIREIPQGHPHQALGLRVLGGGRLLVGDTSNPNPATVYEWNLDASASVSELKVPGGRGAVRRILATADERTIVFVADAGTVSRWDISVTPPVLVWKAFVPTPRGEPHPGSFGGWLSPDERLVAVGSRDGHVRFYRLEDGRLAHDWSVSAHGVNFCAYTPDGAQVIASAVDEKIEGSGEIVLLDPETGVKRPISYAWDGGADSIAILDAKTFAAASEGSVDLWDLDAAAPRRRLLDRRARRPLPGVGTPGLPPVREIALSGDGKRLVGVTSGGTLNIWDVSDGLAPRKEDGPLDEPPRRLAVSADGKTALISGALGPIQVLSLVTGTVAGTLPAPTRVYALAVSPDGSRASSVDEDGIVATWDVAKRERVTGWAAQHSATAFADGEHVLVPDEAGRLAVQTWDTASGAPASASIERSPVVASVGAKDRLLTVSGGAVKLWKASTGAFQDERRKGDPVAWAGFAGDAILVANPERVSLLVGPLGSKPVWDADFKKDPAFVVAGSSDGAYVLVATAAANLILLDGKTGAVVDRMEMMLDPPTDMAAIPGGAKFLVGTLNGGLFEVEPHAE
jgi:WD40 repeat protein